MATCTLTRVVAFSATHAVAVPAWSAERNAAAFGGSARPHRHDYQCAVTVRGTPDPVTGMIVDLKALDRVLREIIVERFDGKDLNADAAFAAAVPTGEQLCLEIWRGVAARLRGAELEAVRVQENPMLYAEYRGA